MATFFYRTEDFGPEEILPYFVETNQDRSIVDALKSRNPVVLEGSRGVGKSFLFRVAEAEVSSEIDTQKVFPVYVTFTKSSLIHTKDPDQFQHWMLTRICARIIRSLRKKGLISVAPTSLSILAGSLPTIQLEEHRIERILKEFETSWQNPGADIDISGLPSIDELKDAIEDLCDELKYERFLIFFDEAAHIFMPQQQRAFFTLFRDLRSPYITCNAAVYPGVTSFGETFQPIHDATLLTLDRDIMASDYVVNMREMVEKQAEDSTLLRNIARNGQNFNLLAYASSGNPRILFKTLANAPKVNKKQVNDIIREYYRTDIWSEHSLLADKYPGHRILIDWGRNFIDDNVLPELQKKNQQYITSDKQTTCFFWIHRDTPQHVREALRLLAYTGIVKEHSIGIKATRAEIGTRYMVNLGCLFSLEAMPSNTAFKIAKNITPKRMSEYGSNHPAYQELLKVVPEYEEPDMSDVLQRQLEKSIDILDITTWQKEQLHKMDMDTIGDILKSTETKLQKAYYVGEIRSRRMRNAAIAAVHEYLSG